MVGIINPLVVIGLTELPNSGWAKVHPDHPLAASLWYIVRNSIKGGDSRAREEIHLAIYEFIVGS